MAELSIIIPVYNVEKYVRQCLDSVLSQVGNYDIEVVIVNDGSTDSSWSIVCALIKEFATIKLLAIEQENQGLSAARNTGLSLCHGNYVFFIDSDDVLQPGTLDKLMPILETNSDIIEVDAFKFEEKISNKTELMDLLSFEEVTSIYSSSQLTSVFKKSKWFVWCRVFKKSLLNGMTFSVGRRYEDMAFTPYLYINAKTIYPLEHYAIGYRQINSSITKKIVQQDITDVIFGMRKLLDIVGAYPHDESMKKNISLTLLKSFQFLKFLNNKVYGYFYIDADTQKLSRDIIKIVKFRGHKFKYLATLYFPRLSGVYSYMKNLDVKKKI